MTNGFNDAPKPSEAIHIPPAALEAGARALREEVRRALGVVEPDPPEGPSPSLMKAYGNEARAAFVAMVGAWPNGYTTETREAWPAELILPLPQETHND